MTVGAAVVSVRTERPSGARSAYRPRHRGAPGAVLPRRAHGAGRPPRLPPVDREVRGDGERVPLGPAPPLEPPAHHLPHDPTRPPALEALAAAGAPRRHGERPHVHEEPIPHGG